MHVIAPKGGQAKWIIFTLALFVDSTGICCLLSGLNFFGPMSRQQIKRSRHNHFESPSFIRFIVIVSRLFVIAAVFLRREEQIWKRDISRVTVTLAGVASWGRTSTNAHVSVCSWQSFSARQGTNKSTSTCATHFRRLPSFK